jgi:hypothetical protein
MKRKMILPLLAVVFALASAFTTTPLVQQGWYDSNGSTEGGGVLGDITTPGGDDPVCTPISGDHLCKISVGEFERNAFNTKANSEEDGDNGTTGRLRYDME